MRRRSGKSELGAMAMRLTACFLVLCLAVAPAAGAEVRTLAFEGLARSYVLHVPAGAGGRDAALVIALHGSGGSGANILEQGRWVEKADAAGFIIVAPDGLPEDNDRPVSFGRNPRSWNSGPNTGSPAQLRNVNDIGFLRAVVADVRRTQRVDPRRIYATGFSNGAAMAFRVGAEMSDIVAAVAPVSNALLVPVERLERPVSLLLIWGSADRLNPPGGGEVRRGGRSYLRPSGEASWRRWAELLACPADGLRKPTAPKVLTRSFVRCAGGSEATFVAVDGLGHQWPGGRVVLRIIAGPGSDALNATDAIWSFFEAHAR